MRQWVALDGTSRLWGYRGYMTEAKLDLEGSCRAIDPRDRSGTRCRGGIVCKEVKSQCIVKRAPKAGLLWEC